MLLLTGCQQSRVPVDIAKEEQGQRTVPLKREASPNFAEEMRAVLYLQSVKTNAEGEQTDQSEGTGFIISPAGYVMTAGHVVLEDEAGFKVVTTATIGGKDGTRLRLQRVTKSTEPDVALLQLPYPMSIEVNHLDRGDSRSVQPGQRLYAIGFPTGVDNMVITEGVLSNPHGPFGNWQLSVPLNPGQSGGPILDAEGKVVAIGVAGADGLDGVTFAVPGAHASVIWSIARAEDSRLAAQRAVIAASSAQAAARRAADSANVDWDFTRTDHMAADTAAVNAVDKAIDAVGTSDRAAELH
jgi:S1-C subfamily serine protease